MAAQWTEILRNQSKGAFEGLTATTLLSLDAHEGLTAAQAAWDPSPDRRSIWQIVDHLARSKDWERQMIEGKRPASPPWGETSGDDRARQATIGRLRDTQAPLLRAIEGLTEDDLLKRPPTRRKWPVVNLILNKAAHDAYHAGQIRYLRALHGLG